MFWFIVLLLVAGAGFYFYQKLTTIEGEIRAEQGAEKARATARAAKPCPESSQPEPAPEEPPAAISPVFEEGKSIEEEIVAAVSNLPGVMQADLYGSFPEVDKKRLQQLIKELADTGRLRREKQGSSFALFPG